MSEKSQICCICGKPFSGYGNNAQPVKDGKCCDKCNFEVVIPARIAEIKTKTEKIVARTSLLQKKSVEGF